MISTTDYYPFGSVQPGRSYTSDAYRYGFNGKEKDPEGLGGGHSTYDYGFRIYNPAIAKFLSVDPLTSSYPWYTPYQFAGNKPIVAIDIDGLEELVYTHSFEKASRTQMKILYISKMLREKLAEISQPERYATHKVYFATKTTGRARGQTRDLGALALSISKYESATGAQKIAAGEKYRKDIERSKKVFEELGISYSEVLSEAQKGKFVFVVAIDIDFLNNSKLIDESTHTIIHEIEAHLIEMLNDGGDIEKDGGVEDHIKYFALDKTENKELYEEYKEYIEKGYSIFYKDFPENSPAGINKAEIEKTIELIKNAIFAY
ncbi:RHS repeat-associated core domain-containing protein [bacterium SCSIO 12643]|nr:RHS repeat-associated core domain-containing protein [bacterium SCSIO 12643]